MNEDNHKSFWQLLFCKKSMIRAVKISLIIGTLLIIINQADMIIAGNMPPLWKIILTYLVPFSVSSYSSAKLLHEINRKQPA